MPPAKRENLWLNLALNVIVPSVLMTRGMDWLPFLTPTAVLLLALAFPISYGIYDKIRRQKVNLFSIIGFVSILITGAIGMLPIKSPHIFALKEAGVPLLFGLLILLTAKSKKPFVRRILFTPELFDVDNIQTALDERGTGPAFDRVMLTCTYWMAASFGLSTVLNYVLARLIVTASPLEENERFIRQVGAMTAWSWVVIVLPSMVVMMIALMKLLRGIETCTGQSFEEALHPDLREKHRQQAAAAEAKQAAKARTAPPKADP